MVFALRLAAILLGVFLFTFVAAAAEIEAFEIPGIDVKFIGIKGDIEDGDSQRFSGIISGLDKATVVLESPGGLVKEALQIGASIRLGNLSTMVAADRECFSACGLIWLSGARRYMSQSSKIGFHAAFRDEGGVARESGMANAEIGSFLTHLGLRIEAIRFFTAAGPNEVLLLTPERARALGIDVYELEGRNVRTPTENPSVDVYAVRFVSYSAMQGRCSPFFQPDMGEVTAGVRRAFDAGNQLVSSEQWIKIWTPLLEVLKSKINERGALLLCIETEALLRNQGQSTGINGPSFDCSLSHSDTETALCADSDLMAKDRAMNAVYLWVKVNVETGIRKKILADQRMWLRLRNGCGRDVLCLNRRYDERLAQMFMFDIPS
jgi:uncharacterized protein YecT (DUF1311 family)